MSTQTADTPRRGKTHPPSKNRVWDFFGQTYSCTQENWQITQCSRPENDPTPTTTASGVHYYGRRYYSPELGRWISRDPIGERGGLNVYGFVANIPLGGTDAIGLQDTLKCSFRHLNDPHGSVERHPGQTGVCQASNDVHRYPGQPPSSTGFCSVYIYITPEGDGCSASVAAGGTTSLAAAHASGHSDWARLQLSAFVTGRLEVDKDKTCCASGKYQVTWSYFYELSSNAVLGDTVKTQAWKYTGISSVLVNPRRITESKGKTEITTDRSFDLWASAEGGSTVATDAPMSYVTHASVSVSCAP